MTVRVTVEGNPRPYNFPSDRSLEATVDLAKRFSPQLSGLGSINIESITVNGKAPRGWSDNLIDGDFVNIKSPPDEQEATAQQEITIHAVIDESPVDESINDTAEINNTQIRDAEDNAIIKAFLGQVDFELEKVTRQLEYFKGVSEDFLEFTQEYQDIFGRMRRRIEQLELHLGDTGQDGE